MVPKLMMEKSMSQLDKIANTLYRSNEAFGLTASMIAKSAGVPRGNVSKRIFDLRSEGYKIHTNYGMRNGVRKAYYLMVS
jgi:biotin operon repressor